jgi:hypothetical protein
MLYDINTSIPSFYIFNASLHDVHILNLVPHEVGSFYVFDKGNINFSKLHKILTHGSFFVSSAKDNTRFKRMFFKTADRSIGVINNQISKLETYYLKGIIQVNFIELRITIKNAKRTPFLNQ